MKDELNQKIADLNNNIEEYIELIGSNYISGSLYSKQNAELQNLEL